MTAVGPEPLRVQVVVRRVVAEACVARRSALLRRGRTRRLGELEVRAERARLLQVLREHLVPPDVGIGHGAARVLHGFLEVFTVKRIVSTNGWHQRTTETYRVMNGTGSSSSSSTSISPAPSASRARCRSISKVMDSLMAILTARCVMKPRSAPEKPWVLEAM